ncbi:MAG: hypothetical protein C0611_11460 [Desulfobacteraceae bacterium]|nr:MAG: hypothetical protein C0611_11460 [Desulfobacteraceae bacterium]
MFRSNKALKDEAIRQRSLANGEPLITKQMKASGSPFGVKIDEKNIIRPARSCLAEAGGFIIWVKCMML